MRYNGASGSAKEIVVILAFVAGLVIVFYMLAKREAESAISGAGKAVSDAVAGIGKAVSDTALTVISPVTDYSEYLTVEKTGWMERVKEGQIPADEPQIYLPILGEKEVYSIPSGGSTTFGSGTKEEDFIDLGYGMLVPKNLYFYNIKVW